MKILAVDNYTANRNPNFNGVNKFCKYSIGTLIAGSSLFMLSNALDTFKSEKVTKEVTSKMDAVASILSLVGTALGLFGIEKVNQKEDSDN